MNLRFRITGLPDTERWDMNYMVMMGQIVKGYKSAKKLYRAEDKNFRFGHDNNGVRYIECIVVVENKGGADKTMSIDLSAIPNDVRLVNPRIG